MTSYKILIGIPSSRRYEPFWESLDKFLKEIRPKYMVEQFIVKDKTIAEARNMIADNFIKSDADFLLFLDDDHTGHSLEMLDALVDPLVNNNSHMCGIQCYTKAFPYVSNILIYSGANEKELGLSDGQGKYMPLDIDTGFFYVDLVGFGMTLLTRKVFNLIKEPYFIGKDNTKEDNYFCDKLISAGIKPVGCFNYCLPHQGVDRKFAREMRERGMAELKQKFPDMKVMVS